MEIPESFKETEIGPLPEDWQVARLGQIIRHDKTTLDPQAYPNEVFEYYSIPAYQESGKPVLERGCSVRSQKLLIQPETVLFGKLNPRVHKVWYVSTGSPRRKIASTEFIPLVAIEGKISSRFLYFLAWSDYLLLKAQKLVSGSTPSRQRVDTRAFLRLPIPLPPLPEQHKIAKVLATIQRAIEQQYNIIATVLDFKKSLMRHLFTYSPVPVAEAERISLKETEIGTIPEDWELETLGGLFDVKQGKAMSPKSRSGISPRPFLRTVNVLWGCVDLSTLDYMDFSDEEMAKLSLHAGDLLVCEGGEIGRTAIWMGEIGVCGYQNHIHRLRKKRQDVLPAFYMYWMQAAFLVFDLYAGREIRTTIPNLSGGRLKSFVVPMPPFSIQQEISDMLSAVDRKIQAEKNHKAALQELLKSMLRRLITGEMRVKDIEV